MKEIIPSKNHIDTDFRAVAKGAELLENGAFEADQVFILPLGPRKRAYAKEIDGYSIYYSESKLKDCLIISSNEDGLYDMLPEGLFHQSPVRNLIFSEEEMIEDVRLRREEERDARKFFSPFEAEVNYMKMLLQWYENRLDKSGTYEDLTDIFAAEWQEFRLFDREQSITWMHLLPLINRKRNDLIFLGQLLSVLFKIPVEVIDDVIQLKNIVVEEALQSKLGTGELGTATILGDGFMAAHEEVIIYIGPAKIDKLINFVPGADGLKIIDLATAHLLPAGTGFRIAFRFEERERKAELGKESNHSFLGQTAYL